MMTIDVETVTELTTEERESVKNDPITDLMKMLNDEREKSRTE